eukprot:scaffold7981_cov49-Phaeocystis_antarctica.AAC.7
MARGLGLELGLGTPVPPWPNPNPNPNTHPSPHGPLVEVDVVRVEIVGDVARLAWLGVGSGLGLRLGLGFRLGLGLGLGLGLCRSTCPPRRGRCRAGAWAATCTR